MPTGQEFQEAIQNPGLSFADAELKQGQPLLNQLGLPKPISGNFASVFTLDCPSGKRYAIKCFFNDLADLRTRYDSIHAYLESVEHPWEVEFAYLPSGIRVAGRWHPIIKMEWVEAVRLDRYVEQHLGQTQVILAVARKFADAVRTLNDTNVAHGDLQHGNILVTADGDLRLVDYDGMYVPSLAGWTSHEIGHPNYQHPNRTARDFGPHIDNFSAWVIYVSLLAVAVDPSVWMRVNGGDDSLVFKRHDFEGGIFSPGFGAVEATGNAQLKAIAAQLRQMVSLDIAKIPPLTSVDLELTQLQRAGPPINSIQPRLQGALPSWMSDVSSVESVAVTGEAVPGIEWMISQLGQLSAAPVDFELGRIRTVLATALALACAAIVLSLIGVISVPVAGLSAVGALFVGFGVCWLIYRRSSEVSAKHAAHQELRAQEKVTNEARLKCEHLAEQRAKNDQSERDRVAELEKRLNQAARAEQTQLQESEKRMQAKLRQIAERRASLSADEQKEQAQVLTRLNQAHVDAELIRYSVSSAAISGIGPALKSNLRAAGINTAADFRGVTVRASGYYSNDIAYIVRSNGRQVRVSGIGPTKARALESWRTRMEARALKGAPTRVPRAEADKIRAKYAAKLDRCSMDERDARAAAVVEAGTARADGAKTQGKLQAEIQDVQVTSAKTRAGLDQELQQARISWNSEQWALARTDRESDAYRDIRFARFLRMSIELGSS